MCHNAKISYFFLVVHRRIVYINEKKSPVCENAQVSSIHQKCNSRATLKSTKRILRSPSCAKALSSFCKAKTRSSKIGTGRQSIYNICILNDCKLTFEFFKNYIFEKRRQFLNRIRAARQGWRADKAITSFHKNRIFVKTRKVMGNTDVVNYRSQLVKAV